MNSLKKQIIKDWKFYGEIAMEYKKEVDENNQYELLLDACKCYNDFLEIYKMWLRATRRKINSKIYPIMKEWLKFSKL